MTLECCSTRIRLIDNKIRLITHHNALLNWWTSQLVPHCILAFRPPMKLKGTSHHLYDSYFGNYIYICDPNVYNYTKIIRAIIEFCSKWVMEPFPSLEFWSPYLGEWGWFWEKDKRSQLCVLTCNNISHFMVLLLLIIHHISSNNNNNNMHITIINIYILLEYI